MFPPPPPPPPVGKTAEVDTAAWASAYKSWSPADSHRPERRHLSRRIRFGSGDSGNSRQPTRTPIYIYIYK